MFLAAAVPPEPHVVVPLGLTHFLIVGGCLAGWFFGISYTLKMPWWKYQMGWNLFVVRFGIGVVLTPGMLHYMWNVDVTSPFYQWFSTIVFGLVFLAVLHSIYMLFIQPSAGKKVKPPAPDSIGSLRDQLKRDRSLDGEPGA